jgi:16S rRNA (uracil1498-N3)-methyltransferase
MDTRPDPRLKRLFVRAGLSAGAEIDLDQGQANYLVNVLRKGEGEEILVFNGRDGEWRAALGSRSRRAHLLRTVSRTREQTPAPDLYYLFAPLKQARLDYMVEKATEMGAGRLRPIMTQHTQVSRLNLDRMEANVIEAAEQCGLLSVPAIDEPVGLARLLDGWASAESDRRLIFCDEGHGHGDAVAILSPLEPSPLAVLIGPEGGFSAPERADLLSRPFVTAIPLGPRILRADTAAVAALAVVQAVLGDWKSAPV